MKIFLITDVHYGENTNYATFKGEEYINHFGADVDKFLPKIRSEMANYDLIINLGDLIKDVRVEDDAAQYEKAVRLFESEKSLKHVIGNHDRRNITPEHLAEMIGESKTYYSFDLFDYHHVVLDPNREGKGTPVMIKDDQMAWLQEDLKNTSQPVLVYCHYPLDEQDISSNLYFKDGKYQAFVANRAEVRKTLEESNKVIGVFSGHLHFGSNMDINGIKYFTIPSFAENDGNHQPMAEYASATVEGKNVKVEILKLNK